MRPRVHCSDPPWEFRDALPDTAGGRARGASGQYPTLNIDDIVRVLARVGVEPDSVLVLWRVTAMAEAAYYVGRALGYEPKCEIVWKKLTRSGGRHFGMGHYIRNEHETAIIMTRGRGAPLLSRSVRSVFEAPVGRHSEKPEIFYTEIIEKLFAGPYCESFARRRRRGWSSFGNELPRERRTRSR